MSQFCACSGTKAAMSGGVRIDWCGVREAASGDQDLDTSDAVGPCWLPRKEWTFQGEPLQGRQGRNVGLLLRSSSDTYKQCHGVTRISQGYFPISDAPINLSGRCFLLRTCTWHSALTGYTYSCRGGKPEHGSDRYFGHTSQRSEAETDVARHIISPVRGYVAPTTTAMLRAGRRCSAPSALPSPRAAPYPAQSPTACLPGAA